MILTLDTWQRVNLAQAVGSLQGDLALMRRGLALLERLELDPAERAAVGYEELPGNAARWKDTGRTFELEVSAAEAELLKAAVTRWPGWPVARAEQVLGLAGQLGIQL